MSNIPADLKYTKEHEWVRDLATVGTVSMGITDFAKSERSARFHGEFPEQDLT